MTRISFIIPTYNRATYIAESLESVLSQAGSDDEVLVVDDGSTDGTELALAPFESRIRYVRQDNAGKPVALNRGLGMTDGAFVWICDDDDLLRPGIVEPMLKRLEISGAELVFGRYTRFRMDGEVRIDMGTGYWPDLSEGSLARHILEDLFVMHNAALVRRCAYQKAGPFDPAMLGSEDYDMFVRLAVQTSMIYFDRIVFGQRKHPGVRGRATAQYPADKSESVWKYFDTRIFAKVGAEVPFAYFEGMFRASHPELSRRAGYLQRGCIMGRHGLWLEALADFREAARTLPGVPLLKLERAICRRAVAGKHGFGGVLESDSQRSLRSVRDTSRVGRAICGEVARGLIWRLRAEDKAARADAVRYLVHPAAAADLIRVLSGPSKAGRTSGEWLSESDTPLAVGREVAARLAASVSGMPPPPRAMAENG